MNPELTAILDAISAVAKLGSGGLDFWKQLHATAAAELDKIASHDTQLKPAPAPGPKE